MEKILVTKENIDDVKDEMAATDQSNELVVGCETWSIVYNEVNGGQMTKWPNGRGAICLGADSEWGDWIDDILETDEGFKYNEEGEEIEP